MAVQLQFSASTFEKNLLTLISKHKCLYTVESSGEESVANAWNIISMSLKKSVHECASKWQSLLNTYLYKMDNTNWPLYKMFLMMEPHLSRKYSQVPTPEQKLAFLSELVEQSGKLLNSDFNPQQRQEIWQKIVNKVNAFKPGAVMPIIKWQKFWYDLKFDFGARWLKIRSKLDSMGIQLETSKYPADEMMILQICGASPTGSYSSIAAAFNSNLEFGVDKELVIQSKKYLSEKDLMVKAPCAKVCALCPNEGTNPCNPRNWSLPAKNLLPNNIASQNVINLCEPCLLELKVKATTIWKACRICESVCSNMEPLHSAENASLRKAFQDATNVLLTEADGLPGYICSACKIQVQQFNNFYYKFSRAQIRLREIQRKKFIGAASFKTVISKVNTTANKVMVLTPEDINFQCNSNQLKTFSLKPQVETQMTKSTVESLSPKIIQIQKPDTVLKKNPTNPITVKTVQTMSQKPNTSSQNLMTTNISLPGNKIYSNKFVTITKRAYDPPPISIQEPFINDVRITNQGFQPSINTIQSEQRYLPANSSVMAKKSTCTAKLPTVNQNLKPTTLPKNKTTVPLEPKSHQGNAFKTNISMGVVGSKPQNNIQTQPTVFTMPDSAEFLSQQAPPVFCISKNKSNPVSTQKNMPNINDVTNLNKSVPPEISDPCPEIKTEKVDYEYLKQLQTATPANLTDNSVQSTTNTRNITLKDMRLVQLNGSTVVVKPHPYINGSYMPIPDQPSVGSETSCISKVQGYSEVEQQLGTSKRARKYWGTVNEFQLSTQPSKLQMIEQPQPIQKRRKTLHTISPWVDDGSASRTHKSQPIQIPDTVQIKDEPEKDEVLVLDDIPNRTNDSDVNPVFYPDSFDFKNAEHQVDISSMITILANQQRTFTPAGTVENNEINQKAEQEIPVIRVPIKKLRVKLRRFNLSNVTRSKNQSNKKNCNTKRDTSLKKKVVPRFH